MARYVWRNGVGFVEPASGEPMPIPERDGICLPRIITEEFVPFESPATGKLITSRAEHREDLAASGCRVLEPDESPTKGRIRNRKFAEKRGLTVSDEYRDYDKSIKRKEAI
jgi:hypothetical protein